MRIPLFLFLSLFLAVLLDAQSNSDLTITELHRVFDVRSHIADVTAVFKFQNNGPQAVDSVLIAFSAEEAARLAYVQAYTSVKKGSGAVLDTNPTTILGNPHKAVFYKVQLAVPLASGSAVSVQVKYVFTHVLSPLPKLITQADPQLVKFVTNAVAFSPYKVSAQTTVLKLGGKVEKYSSSLATQKGEDLESKHENVDAWTYKELSAHYENNSPFVTMRTLVKEVEVSHWGNVAVEETYLLEHTGATLTGSFSRYDYQRIQQKASFRQIVAILPASASDIYYRDHIGNISTSHVRKTSENTIFEVLPRFPMFGGWKADFYMGYNLPASELLSIDANGKYLLNVTFGSPFPQAVIDDFELRVILPEGAGAIEWATPFDIDSQSASTRLTYLDTLGRPVLILKKNNVVRYHAQPLLVSYSFASFSLFREPLMLITAFGLFFLASIFYSHFELSISKEVKVHRGGGSDHNQTREALLDARDLLEQAKNGTVPQHVSEIIKKITDTLHKDHKHADLAKKISELEPSLKAKKKKGKNPQLDAVLDQIGQSL